MSVVLGGTATVEQYKGNPRVQAHGPGKTEVIAYGFTLERRAVITVHHQLGRKFFLKADD